MSITAIRSRSRLRVSFSCQYFYSNRFESPRKSNSRACSDKSASIPKPQHAWSILTWYTGGFGAAAPLGVQTGTKWIPLNAAGTDTKHWSGKSNALGLGAHGICQASTLWLPFHEIWQLFRHADELFSACLLAMYMNYKLILILAVRPHQFVRWHDICSS